MMIQVPQSGIVPLETQRQRNTAGIVYLGLNRESTPFVNKLFIKVGREAGATLRSEINELVTVLRTKLNICRGKTFRNFNKGLKQNKTFQAQ